MARIDVKTWSHTLKKKVTLPESWGNVFNVSSLRRHSFGDWLHGAVG